MIIGAAMLCALARRNTTRAKRLGVAAAAVASLYLGSLAAVALVGRARGLSRGELKYFCEVDCHQVVSLEGVRATEGPDR